MNQKLILNHQSFARFKSIESKANTITGFGFYHHEQFVKTPVFFSSEFHCTIFGYLTQTSGAFFYSYHFELMNLSVFVSAFYQGMFIFCQHAGSCCLQINCSLYQDSARTSHFHGLFVAQSDC